jgi:hypothetical protein
VAIATGYGLDGPRIESRLGVRFSASVQTGPGAHPASCTRGTGSFPGVKSGRDVTLAPRHLLVPWSWKCRAISLLPLWAVRPVQSLSACTRVHIIYLPTLKQVTWPKRSYDGKYKDTMYCRLVQIHRRFVEMSRLHHRDSRVKSLQTSVNSYHTNPAK